MTAARRLAAILAADVVGYSRLMGEDEAGTAKGGARETRGGDADCRWARRPHRQDDGDGLLTEIPSVVVAVERDRPEADGRAERGHAGGEAHPLPRQRETRR
jgi:hypothetical protein